MLRGAAAHQREELRFAVPPDKLRKEYEQLHADIEKAKDALLKSLKAQSGSKRDLAAEISATFTPSNDQFYRALERIESELQAQHDAPFADIDYDGRAIRSWYDPLTSRGQ